MKNQLRIGVVLVSLSLVACGGGGGGGGPTETPDPPTFPLAQAMANFISSSHSYSFVITANSATPVTGSGTITFNAAVGTTFESQSALLQSAPSTFSITVNGITSPASGSANTVYTTNYDPLGSIQASEYCVARGSNNWPATVKVGDTALDFIEDCYLDSTKSTETELRGVTVLIEADSSNSAFVNVLASTNSFPGNVLLTTDLNQYRIDTDGNLQWVKETNTDYTTTPPSTITDTVQ